MWKRIKENLSKSKLDFSIFISCIIVAILCITLLVIIISRDSGINNEVEVHVTASATDAQKETTTAEETTTEEETTETESAAEIAKETEEPSILKVDANMSSEWGGEGTLFMQYDIVLTNLLDEDIEDWEISLSFTKDVEASQSWGCESTGENATLIITPADYTKYITAGASAEGIGIIISADDYAYLAEYTVKAADKTETIKLETPEEETASAAASDSDTTNTNNTNTENQNNKSTAQQTTEQVTQQQTAAQTTQTAAVTAATGYYAEHGALSVSGANLCDSSGNVFQLKGVSTHGLSWYPEYVNKEAFSSLKSMGVNTIRLAMYTSEYNGYCNGGDKNTLKQTVKNGVEYATELGMYVIIDWHILSDGNPNTYVSDAISFFDEMSKTYASYGNVLYEICNEPNGASWSDVKTYAQQVIPVIRANDKNGIIIVGTPTWSQDVDTAASDPITGYSNIVYALHFYAATHKDDIRNKLVTAHNKGLPVFVSEFSICESSGNGNNDTSSAETWLDLLNSYGVSYVAWNLSNKAESSSLLSSSCTKTGGFTYDDFSESGKWFLNQLK